MYMPIYVKQKTDTLKILLKMKFNFRVANSVHNFVNVQPGKLIVLHWRPVFTTLNIFFLSKYRYNFSIVRDHAFVSISLFLQCNEVFDILQKLEGLKS